MPSWLRAILVFMGFEDLLPPLQTPRPVPHRVPLEVRPGSASSTPKNKVTHRRTDNTTHAALALAHERQWHPPKSSTSEFDLTVGYFDARSKVNRDQGLRDLDPNTPSDSEQL
jgi:hypothetical protein